MSFNDIYESIADLAKKQANKWNKPDVKPEFCDDIKLGLDTRMYPVLVAWNGEKKVWYDMSTNSEVDILWWKEIERPC